VKLLAFSDLHRDLDQARRLVELSAEAEVVIGAGDFASVHRGLEDTLGELSAITTPTILVPGNNETDAALRQAAGAWSAARVLHGAGTEIDGVAFYGLGAGVPTTPWDWSFDLTDEEAESLLAACPEDAVLVSHSPPKGHLDRDLGSQAVLAAIEAKRPRLVVCGHVHECAGHWSEIGATRVLNAGPAGTFIDV